MYGVRNYLRVSTLSDSPREAAYDAAQRGACRNGGKSMTHRAACALHGETWRVTRSGRTKVRSCSSALLQAMGPYLMRSGAKEEVKI